MSGKIQRETDRDRETETDRERDRQTDRETEASSGAGTVDDLSCKRIFGPFVGSGQRLAIRVPKENQTAPTWRNAVCVRVCVCVCVCV